MSSVAGPSQAAHPTASKLRAKAVVFMASVIVVVGHWAVVTGASIESTGHYRLETATISSAKWIDSMFTRVSMPSEDVMVTASSTTSMA